MKVHVEPNPVRDRVDVFVDLGGGHWLTLGPHGSERMEVPPGAMPPVYVSLPTWIAEQLKDGLEGRRAPDAESHLADTIVVRDRLLTMIESAWERRSSLTRDAAPPSSSASEIPS